MRSVFFRKIITTVIIFLATISFSGCAVHGLQHAAERGDVIAQFDLGLAYHNGQGVPQSDEQAAYWWGKAANQGDANAQFNLGLFYFDGIGVPQSDEQAVYWWRKAANQGNAGAQNNLGRMYEQGRGVNQDYIEARQWYQRAAAQGNVKALKAIKNMPANQGSENKDEISAIEKKQIETNSNQGKSAPQASSCESQANKCGRCENGRYHGIGYLCIYSSLEECRDDIIHICKTAPRSSGDKGLNVRGGRLTNAQVRDLELSCPNISRGPMPHIGSTPEPRSKKAQQCEAYRNARDACVLAVFAGPKVLVECVRNSYKGP